MTQDVKIVPDRYSKTVAVDALGQLVVRIRELLQLDGQSHDLTEVEQRLLCTQQTNDFFHLVGG
ncbi:hypothetical protein [Amycolatopsis sp. NPDC003731]